MNMFVFQCFRRRILFMRWDWGIRRLSLRLLLWGKVLFQEAGIKESFSGMLMGITRPNILVKRGVAFAGLGNGRTRLWLFARGTTPLEFAEQRSSTVEILQLDGLRPVQKIEMGTPVLDVAFLEDIMYVSLDAKEGQWVKEYAHTGKGWKIIESSQWEITKREETSVEMYWLETMRKRIGQGDEE